MNQSISRAHEECDSLEKSDHLRASTCLQCGGNGYMKTSPNCYHTCLSCLGRGSIIQSSSIDN